MPEKILRQRPALLKTQDDSHCNIRGHLCTANAGILPAQSSKQTKITLITSKYESVSCIIGMRVQNSISTTITYFGRPNNHNTCIMSTSFEYAYQFSIFCRSINFISNFIGKRNSFDLFPILWLAMFSPSATAWIPQIIQKRLHLIILLHIFLTPEPIRICSINIITARENCFPWTSSLFLFAHLWSIENVDPTGLAHQNSEKVQKQQLPHLIILNL